MNERAWESGLPVVSTENVASLTTGESLVASPEWERIIADSPLADYLRELTEDQVLRLERIFNLAGQPPNLLRHIESENRDQAIVLLTRVIGDATNDEAKRAAVALSEL